MFVHAREPRPEWIEACERIAPRSEHVNWLLPFWEAGESWNPVQRWVIREMVPRISNPILQAAYAGPNPRTLGAWVNGEWRNPSPISREQWELFHQTGCHSRRVWIVQGEHGGHPRSFTYAEQQAAKARGLPDSPPAVGSLPYAEPDTRTFSRLAELDKLRKWHERFTTPWDARQMSKTVAGLWTWRDRRDDYEAWGTAMDQWFTEGIKEAIDGVSKRDWAMVANLPDPGPEPDRDPEATERLFHHSSALGTAYED